MIRLTLPDGSPVEIDPAQISMMQPNPGTYHPAAKTILLIGSDHQAVKETMDQIDALRKGK